MTIDLDEGREAVGASERLLETGARSFGRRWSRQDRVTDMEHGRCGFSENRTPERGFATVHLNEPQPLIRLTEVAALLERRASTSKGANPELLKDRR